MYYVSRTRRTSSSSLLFQQYARRYLSTSTNKEQDQPKTQSYDVLIVGGGIVGSTLGCLLGQNPLLRDKRIGMIDPNPRTLVSPPGVPDLRSYTITPSSQQILSDIGVWQNMIQENPSHATPFQEMKIWDDFGFGYGKLNV